MEILQPSWRGRDIQTRKDAGGKYTAMIGAKALLYIPVNVVPKAIYNVTIELCRENGNGILCCNIYGNKNFDFTASEITCDRDEWSTYSVDIVTGHFPPTVPTIFRMWRGPKGTGTVLIRKVTIEFIKGETSKPQTTAKLISIDSAVPPPPPPKKINPKKPRSKRIRERPRKRARAVSRMPKPPKGLVCSKNHNVNKGAKRVLYLPVNSTAIFQTGMENAFIENGYDLHTFDFRNYFASNGAGPTNEAFKKVCYDFQPDWIHMQLQFTGMIRSGTINDIRKMLPNAIITNWTGDVRAEIKPYFVEIGKQVDLALMSNEGQINLYKSAGCPNVDYWQIGINPKKFHPLSNDVRVKLYDKYNHDVVFCAVCSNHFPDSDLRKRAVFELFNILGNKFAVYGCGWKRTKAARGTVGYYAQNEVYNGSKIVININHFNNIPMYFSDRQLIAMASGTPVICHYTPGLEKYFENKKDVIWFRSLEECKELVLYYLNNPLEAAEIGKNGATKVIEQHSDYRRVRELSIRIGMVDEASNEEIAKQRQPSVKGRKYRTMAVVRESIDRRYEQRVSIANIDFQGIYYDPHVIKRVAEYQPDILYVDLVLLKKLRKKLNILRRRMPKTSFVCFSDTLNKTSLSKLKEIFDYVVARIPHPEIENDPRVVRLYVDEPLKMKDRKDLIEEIQLIVEKIG